MRAFARKTKKYYRVVLRSSAHEAFTRFGYVSKGCVYFLIGLLFLLGASDRSPRDQRSFLERLPENRLGAPALVVIAGGMLCYAVWRFICALSDSPVVGRHARSLSGRAARFGSGLAYTGVALYALRLLVSGSVNGDTLASRTWTARMFELPGGPWLIAAMGLAVIFGGVLQIRRGLQERFRENVRTLTMSPAGKRWTRRAGKWGHAARGAVFGLVGVFLIFAAWDTDPGEGRGLEQAFDSVAAQPFGPWLMGLVAAGLLCYAAWCMIQARYSRITH